MSAKDVIEIVGGHFEPILKFFTDAFLILNFGPFVAGLLLAVGLLITVVLFSRVTLTMWRIGSARRHIRMTSDATEFANKFESIDHYLKVNAAIATPWRSFAAGLSFPDLNRTGIGASRVIRSPIRPQVYFLSDEPSLSLSYFRLWPNLFVGIGLVLTFAGLISALTVAVGGFAEAGATSAKLQASLGELLRVSAAKFYSSLAALAVSLFLTVFIRLAQSVINQALSSIAHSIEERILPVTPEALLEEQMRELQEQTSQLKTFNTDLAMKIGDSVERAVGNAMHGVTEKLDKFTSNLGQDNVAAIRDIGESVTRSLHGAAGDSLSRLTERLDTVGGALSALVGSLERSGQSFQNDMASAMEGLRADLAGMAASLVGVSDGLRSTLQEGASGITASLETAIRALTTATERSAGQMEEAVKRLSDGVRVAATSAAEQAGRTVSAAGTSAGQQLADTVAKVAEEFSSGFAPVQHAATALSESLAAMRTSADRLDIGLTKAAESAATAGARLQDAAQQVNSASQSLRQTIEPALSATQRIQESSNAMREAAQSALQAANGIAADLQATRALWDKHSSRFDDVDRALGNTFQQLTRGLAENLQRLNEFVQATDSQFSQAVNAMSDAIEELGTVRSPAMAR